ncbi:hypothetical protein B8W95_13405, partial [Staphylococcus pasteuri]
LAGRHVDEEFDRPNTDDDCDSSHDDDDDNDDDRDDRDDYHHRDRDHDDGYARSRGQSTTPRRDTGAGASAADRWATVSLGADR